MVRTSVMKTNTTPYLPSLIVLAVCVCLAPRTAICCDITVSPSEGIEGIKDAVDGWSSSSSLLVCLVEGNYPVYNENAGNVDPSSVSGSVTIRGYGPSKTRIDLNGVNTHFISCGAGGVVFLEEVLIASGDRAPVRITNAEIEINNVNFRNNAGRDFIPIAGGVEAYSSVVTISNCQFTDNAGTEAGAIYANDSDVSVSNSLFEDNYSFNTGGAITAKNTDLDLYNNVIQINEADGDGGGVYSDGGDMDIYDGLVYSNSPNGVVCVSNERCSVNDGVIAFHKGAGLYVESSVIEISLYRAALCENGENLDCHSIHDECEFSEYPCTLDEIDVDYGTEFEGCCAESVIEDETSSVLAVAIIVPVSLVVVVGCTALVAVMVSRSRNNNVEEGTNNATKTAPTPEVRDPTPDMILGAGNGVAYKPRRQSNNPFLSSSSVSTNSSSSSVSASSSSDSGSESESDPYVDGVPPPSYQAAVKTRKK